MKFRQKIWTLPLSAGLVFVVGVAISFLIGARTSASLDHLAHVDSPTLEQAQRLERAIEGLRLMLQAAVAEGDAEKLADAKPMVDSAHRALDTMAAIADSKPMADKLRQLYDAYQTAALGATRSMLSQSGSGGGDQLNRMQAAQASLEKELQQALNVATEAVATSQAAAQSGVRQAQWLSLATGLVVLGVLGGASLFIIRSVWRELGGEPAELQQMVHEIATGNLQVQPQVIAGDTQSLNASLAQMVGRLGDTVNTIRMAADSIEFSSSEIAAGSLDLSNRTESTAANLQVTSSSVETLTSSVRHSADSARQANSLASAAAQAAQQGGAIVSQVVSNMDEINSASRRIGEIIGVIDGIAFQTNILALNAAVEAARAGEQGRGFAVVAGEVRNLAQRSAEAAKEIKSLIGASSSKVESGTRLVHEAGTAMQDIVSGVQRVSDVIAEISAATHEQSDGIGQVNQTVSELDRMTQQNAALVEESAAAAASMREQATRLAESVAAFRTTTIRAADQPTASAVPVRASQPVRPAAAPKAKAPAPAPAPVAAPTTRQDVRSDVETETWEAF